MSVNVLLRLAVDLWVMMRGRRRNKLRFIFKLAQLSHIVHRKLYSCSDWNIYINNKNSVVKKLFTVFFNSISRVANASMLRFLIDKPSHSTSVTFGRWRRIEWPSRIVCISIRVSCVSENRRWISIMMDYQLFSVLIKIKWIRLTKFFTIFEISKLKKIK